MDRKTIQCSRGKIKCVDVLTTVTVIKDEPDGSVSMCKHPALLTLSLFETIPDEPALSISIGDMTIVVEFNSDFPLLFEEGIKLWK